MKRTSNAVAVFLVSLLICTCACAGIKGGTLSITDVTPTVCKSMNRQNSLFKLSSETLTLKDNRRFLRLHIEVSVDWSDNDKATEHTILRNLIKLTDRQGTELPLLGRHAGNGDLAESIASHIHLQKSDGNPYLGDLVFAIPAELGKCTLNIEEAVREISIPSQPAKPTYKPIANFKVVKTALLDHIQAGQVPKPTDIFESTVKPLKGNILEVTLEIEPLGPTVPKNLYEGFGSNRKRFSCDTADIGILLEEDSHLYSIAGRMNGKAYAGVGSSQTFRDKWRTIEKTVYFCVPSDVKEFRITHDKHPVAQGRVGK